MSQWHFIATDRFLRVHGINNAKIIPMVIMANDGAIIDNQFEIGIKSFGLSIVLTLILTLLLSNIFKGLMVIIAPVICYYIFKYIRCEIADDTQSTMLFKRWMYIVNNHVTLEEYYQ
jgi:hypothetical protein